MLKLIIVPSKVVWASATPAESRTGSEAGGAVSIGFGAGLLGTGGTGA